MTSSMMSSDVFFITSLPVVGLESSNFVKMSQLTSKIVFLTFGIDDVIDDVIRCILHYISAYSMPKTLKFDQNVSFDI